VLVPHTPNGMVSGPGIGLEKKSFLNETDAPPTKRARLGFHLSYSCDRLQMIRPVAIFAAIYVLYWRCSFPVHFVSFGR